MSIKLKVFLISIISALVIIVFTTSIFYSIILRYISRIEDQSINNSFEILGSIIKREEKDIKRTSLDWAHWDDTYNFLLYKNKEYIESNLKDNTLERLNLKFMYFISSDNKIFYEKVNDLKEEEKDDLVEKIFNKIKKIDNSKKSIDAESGIVFSSNKLFIVSICPITTSDEIAKSNGKLVIGRYVDAELLTYINK